jgi:hypothetical protein
VGRHDSRTALGFVEEQLAVALHLRAKLNNVGAPHAGVEQQIASASDHARMPSGLRLGSFATSRAGFFWRSHTRALSPTRIAAARP